MTTPAPLRDQLAAAMQSRGITQYRLAQLSGVASTSICRYLGGHRDITTATFDRLAAAVGLKLEIVDR